MRSVAVLVLVTTRLAAAEPPGLTPVLEPDDAPLPPPMAAPVDTGVQSYPELTLASDAVAVGLMALAIDREEAGLAKLSLATYALGGPIIHIIKKRSGRAFGSLGLRVGLPLLGLMIGVNTEQGGSFEGAFLGAAAGAVTASIIDAAYLAKGDPKPAPQLAVTPTIKSTQGGYLAGVRLRF